MPLTGNQDVDKARMALYKARRKEMAEIDKHARLMMSSLYALRSMYPPSSAKAWGLIPLSQTELEKIIARTKKLDPEE